MKVRRFSDGNLYFHCLGCDREHALSDLSGGWAFNGDYERPTFQPSIRWTGMTAKGRTTCHSYITDGRIEFLNDSQHELAGQTVELPNINDYLVE